MITAIIIILLLFVSLSNGFPSSATPSVFVQSSPSPNPTPTPTGVPTIAPTATPTAVPSATPVVGLAPLDFTCGHFTVTVTMNLSDEMNTAEAVMVANRIIEHELTNASYELKSAQVNDVDVWNVDFAWEYNSFSLLPDGQVAPSLALSHYFDVTINPITRTASIHQMPITSP